MTRFLGVVAVFAVLAAIAFFRPAGEAEPDEAPRGPVLPDVTSRSAAFPASLPPPDPEGEPAWWAATGPRFEAMLAGDREGYRALLETSRRASDTAKSPRVAWGRLVASTAPETQERAIGWVAQNGLLGTGIEDLLGAGACGVRAPDFVVCVP